jgi:hypothetical protein
MTRSYGPSWSNDVDSTLAAEFSLRLPSPNVCLHRKPKHAKKSIPNSSYAVGECKNMRRPISLRVSPAMIIALTENEPIEVVLNGVGFRILGVGCDGMRSYIGASDGNTITQLSPFFIDNKSFKSAWHHGFTVLNDPEAESIALALIEQGRAVGNSQSTTP